MEEVKNEREENKEDILTASVLEENLRF